MPAYSILAWLRRRRAVTRGVRRPTEAFRSAFSAFTGHYYSARPPLLLPPANWREVLRAVQRDALEEPATYADSDSNAEPVMETVEVRAPAPTRGAPRETLRPDKPREPQQIAPLRAERLVGAAPPISARQQVDSAAASAAPDRIVAPRPMSEPHAERVQPVLPPREAGSPAVPEEAPALATSRPPTAAANRPSVSERRNDEPLVSTTQSTASNVRAQSEQTADATGVVAPVEGVKHDRATEPPRLVTPSALPPTDVPASPPVTAGAETRTQPDEPPRAPRADSPRREVPSAVHPPRTVVSSPPATTRQDRISLEAPLSPMSESVESNIAPVIRAADVPASAEAEPVSPTAPTARVPIAPSPSEPVGVPQVAASSQRSGVDDSLMTETEARETVPSPSRAPIVNHDSSDLDITVPRATLAPATEEQSVSEAVASPRGEKVSPGPSVEPQSDVKTQTTPVVERRSGPPTNQPSGIRPTEERQSRRSRPAAPADAAHQQQRQATAPPSAQPREAQPSQTGVNASAERSMVDWRRLLFEATSESQPRAARVSNTPERRTEPSRPTAAPAKQTAVVDKPIETQPLLESTRRFLRPRVGIDPATVPVVRGPVADRLIRDAGADAAAVADAVVLPSSFDERSPKDLGVLAHELTHVAQRRQPRFVPPAIRSPNVRSASTERGESPRSAMPFSEEQLARRVERSVWNDAEQIAPEDRETSMADGSDPGASTGNVARSYTTPRTQHESSEWGGLPAPWEPLPTLAPTAAASVSAPVVVATSAGEQTIHYAEQGRSLDGEHAAPTHSAAPSDAAPPPDLDALARRVYDVLKRRLAAERRREG